MRTKHFFPGLFIAVLLLSLPVLFTACDKEETPEADNTEETNFIKEEIANEAMLDDISLLSADAADMAMDSLQGPHPGGPKPPHWGPCATITIVPFDTINWPKTITVDFGPVNCLCNDGRYRRGQIISVVSAPPHDSLSTRTVSPQNYYINDHLIEGVRTFINQGHINGMLTLSSSLVGGKITRPNGDTATMEAQTTRVFAAGEQTPFPAIYDDVWMISGSRNGTMFNGMTYTMSITTPLEVPRACQWIVSGVRETQRGTSPLRIIDFGNGACDNIASLTINGNTQTIYLP